MPRPTLTDALVVLAVSALYGFAVTTIEHPFIALAVVASYAAIVAWQRWRG